MSEIPSERPVKKHTRRSALRMIAAATALAPATFTALTQKRQDPPKNTPVEGNQATVHEVNPSDEHTYLSYAEKVLNTPLDIDKKSDVRKTAEQELVNKTHSLEEIDESLSIVVSRNLRRQLLSKRWELRENGHPNLKKLSIRDRRWAIENGIRMESLAMCIDTYNIWVSTIYILQEAGVYKKNSPANEMIISPYGMAKLAHIESEGFENIGKFPAIGEINAVDYPNEIDALNQLIESANHMLGLSYNTNHVPGSENPQGPQASGGALGPMQLMPSSANEIREELANNIFPPQPFNVFDIKSSLVASALILAGKGYLAGDDNRILQALKSWNNNEEHAKNVMKADKEYRKAYPLKAA